MAKISLQAFSALDPFLAKDKGKKCPSAVEDTQKDFGGFSPPKRRLRWLNAKKGLSPEWSRAGVFVSIEETRN
jgi:hypothetical protein